MADQFDKAAEFEQLHRDVAMMNLARAPVVVATGACLNCQAPLPDQRRWCDADCRDDWEADRKRRSH